MTKKQDTASTHFQLINKAYSILSDPSTRYIYDKYGPKAADECWKLESSKLNPKEMDKEYQKSLEDDYDPESLKVCLLSCRE